MEKDVPTSALFLDEMLANRLIAVVVCAAVVHGSAWVDPLPGCPTFPARAPPTSITDLRPQDVKVVCCRYWPVCGGFWCNVHIKEESNAQR